MKEIIAGGETQDAALLFIPDISGFTKFVHATEIQHAKHIIEELMEAILSANEIGLELSEIEGDALLLYREGPAPASHELLDQLKKMYLRFHAHLKKYETLRICSCGACCSAVDLKLKFIAHYGEISLTDIRGRIGLFGKAVIAAHRLLKNDIRSDEYGLFTNELMSASPTWSTLPEVAWDDTFEKEEEYDFGPARYTYLTLENLMELVPDPIPEDFSIPGAVQKVFETTGTIHAPIDITFNVISDYYFRANFFVWQFGNEKQNHKIFQNGSVHKCIVGRKDADPIFVAHDFAFQKNKITFVESDHNDGVSLVWTLLNLDGKKTKIEIAILVKPNFFKVLVFNLFMKRKTAKQMKESWLLLDAYCKKLVFEKKRHPHELRLPEEVLPSK